MQGQLAEHGNGLPRERNDVNAGNFPLLGRDFSFFPFEVDLFPFGFPQFSGADEGVRLELQRASDDRRPVQVVDGAHQRAHTSAGSVMVG